jgi:hypothetical protein
MGLKKPNFEALLDQVGELHFYDLMWDANRPVHAQSSLASRCSNAILREGHF